MVDVYIALNYYEYIGSQNMYTVVLDLVVKLLSKFVGNMNPVNTAVLLQYVERYSISSKQSAINAMIVSKYDVSILMQ